MDAMGDTDKFTKKCRNPSQLGILLLIVTPNNRSNLNVQVVLISFSDLCRTDRQ